LTSHLCKALQLLHRTKPLRLQLGSTWLEVDCEGPGHLVGWLQVCAYNMLRVAGGD
jgi:hypothetical protein